VGFGDEVGGRRTLTVKVETGEVLVLLPGDERQLLNWHQWISRRAYEVSGWWHFCVWCLTTRGG
jgi:hypothetical protein